MSRAEASSNANWTAQRCSGTGGVLQIPPKCLRRVGQPHPDGNSHSPTPKLPCMYTHTQAHTNTNARIHAHTPPGPPFHSCLCPHPQVMGQGQGTYKASSSSSLLSRRNPPLRDTVTVPQYGWVVLLAGRQPRQLAAALPLPVVGAAAPQHCHRRCPDAGQGMAVWGAPSNNAAPAHVGCIRLCGRLGQPGRQLPCFSTDPAYVAGRHISTAPPAARCADQSAGHGACTNGQLQVHDNQHTLLIAAGCVARC